MPVFSGRHATQVKSRCGVRRRYCTLLSWPEISTPFGRPAWLPLRAHSMNPSGCAEEVDNPDAEPVSERPPMVTLGEPNALPACPTAIGPR